MHERSKKRMSDGDMELSYVQDMAIVIEKLENLL